MGRTGGVGSLTGRLGLNSRKLRMTCEWPFSEMVKSDFWRSWTDLPSASVTMTSTTTSREVTWRVWTAGAAGGSADAGGWAVAVRVRARVMRIAVPSRVGGLFIGGPGIGVKEGRNAGVSPLR